MILKKSKDKIIEIAKELPEWFTPKALVQIEKDLKNCSVLVDNDNSIRGFIIYSIRGEKCFIKWMAVQKDVCRMGIGKTYDK